MFERMDNVVYYLHVQFMRFHPKLILDLSLFVAKKKLKGQKRFSMVLMLEPLHACNLSCDGCGRIREYLPTINEKLSLEQCFDAVDQAGTPVVSLAGGEPTIYPQIVQLVEGLVARKKHIYLCTHGMFLDRVLPKLKPSPYLNINVSLDAMKDNHNRWRNNNKVFDLAVAGIKQAKQLGFRVVTNTTIFKESDMNEIEQLFDLLTQLGTDGMIVTPGFSYKEIDKELTLTRDEVRRKFSRLDDMRKKYKILASPLYAKFLKGEREFTCMPWGNPTRNTKGWKGPCYLITDAHHASYRDLMQKTDWEKYGTGKDPRCENCMVHVGYETAAADEAGKSIKDLIETIAWNFTGRN